MKNYLTTKGSLREGKKKNFIVQTEVTYKQIGGKGACEEKFQTTRGKLHGPMAVSCSWLESGLTETVIKLDLLADDSV